MTPNTPTKITRMIHRRIWCRWSISCAIFDAGLWKYQAMACAALEAPSAARPAASVTSLLPLM